MIIPVVSVILPVYNAGAFLRQAVASVIAQSFADYELIAIDDGSTDNSLEILNSMARLDPRLRVISRPNTGIVGALNDGIASARGEFLARMDADDVALQDRFGVQVRYLRKYAKVVALGTDVLYVDPEGSPLVTHRPGLLHQEVLMQLVEGNGGALIHPSVMFRREAVVRAGGYRQEFNFIEDLDLYLRLTDQGDLANLPEVHLHYRQHLQSVNRTRGTRTVQRRKIVDSYRKGCGMGPLEGGFVDVEPSRTAAGWRRVWAYDAARGGHWESARKNAALAVRGAPWNWHNWRCWRYVRAASKSRLSQGNLSTM